MKAITIHAPGDLRFEEVCEPGLIDPRDAIVQIEATAICGSDLHVVHGRERGLDPGSIMGHEFVGLVVERGSDVELAIGTRVASPFTTSCGTCFYCREGLTSRCEHGQLFGWVEHGHGLHGAQTERVRVPLADTTLVPVPATMDPGHALLAGDVLATGLYCAQRGGARPGRSVAVVGCGPVGLMAVVAARHLGSETVIAIDRVEGRLELARAYGAEPLHLDRDQPLATIQGRSSGRGADVVLEAVGSDGAARLAYELVRPGGTVSTVGVHTSDRLAFDPVEAYAKNITYRIGRCPARHMMGEAFTIIESGRFDLDPVLSHRLPLSEGLEGYRLFDGREPGCIKVVLDPTM